MAPPNDDGGFATVPGAGDVGRRRVLQWLGLGALAGAGIGPTARSRARTPVADAAPEPDEAATPAQQPVTDGGLGMLPVGDGGYDTIQGAWEAATDGDVIRVLGSYDAQAAGEPFPITLDYTRKQVSLVGGHPSGSVIDAGDADANVIEVRGVGSDDYLNQPEVRDLRLTGGQIGLRIRGAPFAAYQNLLFDGTGSHGSRIEGYRNRAGLPIGSFNTMFFNCEAWGCGGDGFSSVADAESHETYYLGCRATANRGAGFRVRGSASKLIGGVSQLNHSYGVVARQGNSITVDSLYLEGNGRSESYPIEVLAGQTMATTVQNCYFHGINPRPTPGHDFDLVQRGVNFYEVDTGAVQRCTGRRYGSGLAAVVDSEDIDVNIASHATVNTDVLANDDPHASGNERTRSAGMILPGDLRDVDGQFPGDVGYHVGPDSEGPAYWRDGDWHVARTQRL